ncbi:hypothetical protein JD969_14670 [Planctomycetota bacterium]|nr:hypothetical protein JD969_14670 [Planctomycetota bacterium]
MNMKALLCGTTLAAAALIAAPVMGASYSQTVKDWAPVPSENDFTVNVNFANPEPVPVGNTGKIEFWFYGDLIEIVDYVDISINGNAMHLGRYYDEQIDPGDRFYGTGGETRIYGVDNQLDIWFTNQIKSNPGFDQEQLFANGSLFDQATWVDKGANVNDEGNALDIFYGSLELTEAELNAIVSGANPDLVISMLFNEEVDNVSPPGPYNEWLKVQLTYVPSPAAASMGLASLCIMAFRRRRIAQ